MRLSLRPGRSPVTGPLAQPGSRRGVRAAGRRPPCRARPAGGRAAARAVRAEQARGGGEGAGLACVPAPVPRPDAARPRRRGGRQHGRAAGVQHRDRDPRLDRRQRDPRPESGGEGGRERRGAAEDAHHQGHARRGGEAVDIPAEELVPGDIVSFEAGDKIPADGRLVVAAALEIEEAALTGESTPVQQVRRPGAGRRGAARRPRGHGVHELDRDARSRRDGGHGDGHGDGGRPDLGDAQPASSRRRHR